MSGHEHERLSAYLDDELATGERAAVDAHLAACAACAARLAELAAVDEAARSLPVEAPRGYFESFPARVRARLEPRRAGARLPVWTWAAAAALLLAVVTPLTLMQRRAAPPSAPAREVPAAAPEAPVLPQAAAEAPAPEARAPEARAPEAARDERKTSPKGEPRREAPLEGAHPSATRVPAAPGPAKQEQAFAAAPAPEDDTRVAREAVPAPAASAAALEQEAAAVADAVTTPGAGGASARNQAQALESRKAAESTPGRGRVAAPAAGTLASAKSDSAEADWRRLDAMRPLTPGDWRRLREEWRRFAAHAPDGPHADEARVRAIEAGYEAWRTGGDPADEALFRRDAAAYLEREDAKQKPRVSELRARD